MLAEVPQLTNEGFVVVLTARPEIEAQAVETDRVRVDYAVSDGLLLGGRLESTPEYSDLFLAFNDLPGVAIQYDSLRFGYALSQPGSFKDGQWPPRGARYISSDQAYLQPVRIEHAPDTETTLVVWALNAGQQYTAVLHFVTPRLPEVVP